MTIMCRAEIQMSGSIALHEKSIARRTRTALARNLPVAQTRPAAAWLLERGFGDQLELRGAVGVGDFDVVWNVNVGVDIRDVGVDVGDI